MDFSILTQIRETNSSKEKIAIGTRRIDSALHKYLEACYNETIYGIAKKGIAKAIGYDEEIHGRFEDLGYFLEERPLKVTPVLITQEVEFDNFLHETQQRSGDIQIAHVRQMLTRIEPSKHPWYIRALLKDPKIGMNISTYNKIREAQGLPVLTKFFVKLARPSTHKKFQSIPFPVAVETKFDGERSICEYKKNLSTTYTSRAGNDITKQFPEAVSLINSLYDKVEHITSIVLDGEIVVIGEDGVSSNFNELSKRMGRKESNIESSDKISYLVYDILEVNGQNFRDRPQSDRYQLLKQYVEPTVLSEVTIVNNFDELNSYYEATVEKGEEGIMVKELDTIWEDSRNGWWKHKPVNEIDLQIVDIAYGEGANANLISRIRCSTSCGQLFTWIGSGFKKSERVFMTENKDELIGKIVEIHYFEISKTDKGLSLRFPRFKRFRTDKLEANAYEE